MEINQQQGTVSGRFDLHRAPLNAPLKFKAWISPRGEEAPNYVSYTMLNIHLGTTTTPTCYDNGIQVGFPPPLRGPLCPVPIAVSALAAPACLAL